MDFFTFREEVTRYLFVEDQPEKADIIWIPGNGYPQNAQRAAELYRLGLAPYILPSGRYSTVTGKFAGVQEHAERYCKAYETEWEFMRDVLLQNDVEETAILREDRATYTWENAQYSRTVTDQAGIPVRKAILCCRNVHARRSLMYYQKAYPEAEIFVCPTVIGGITRDNWYTAKEGVDAVNGELTRILYQFSLLTDCV